MTEEIKDVNAKIDAAEEAVKKYASKDTVISIGGYEFTPAKLMVAFTLVSSLLGGLYGCFEVYKDYQDMKTKITKYVAPDLSEFDKRLAVLEQNSQKQVDATDTIKNDLKGDIRRQGDQIDQVERASKQVQRDTSTDVQELRKDLRQLSKDVDSKIQKAMDNPLAK
jgi:outer membrane murein-binding lipoprotein Lpp